MTRGEATTIGERVRALEVLLISVKEQAGEHKDETADLRKMIRKVIENQQDGARDRAAIKESLDAMRPHVEAWKSTRTALKTLGWLGSGIAAMIGFVAGVKDSLLSWAHWLWGR